MTAVATHRALRRASDYGDPPRGTTAKSTGLGCFPKELQSLRVRYGPDNKGLDYKDHREVRRMRAVVIRENRAKNREACAHAPDGYRHETPLRWDALIGLGPLVSAWHRRDPSLFGELVRAGGQEDQGDEE